MSTNHNHPFSPGIDAISTAANLALSGHINTAGDFTLTANQATTVVSNYYMSPDKLVLWMPITANAAAEIGAGGMYVSTTADGSFTITHANNAQTDRDFSYVVLG